MKEFIFSSMAVVVLSVVIEMFCPIKSMKKPVIMALSLVLLFVVASGIKSVFNNEKINFQDVKLSLNTSTDSMISSMVDVTETQVFNTILQNGCEVESVKLDYEINEFSVEYTGVKIKVKKNQDQDKIKQLASNLLDVDVEDVEVYE